MPPASAESWRERVKGEREVKKQDTESVCMLLSVCTSCWNASRVTSVHLKSDLFNFIKQVISKRLYVFVMFTLTGELSNSQGCPGARQKDVFLKSHRPISSQNKVLKQNHTHTLHAASRRSTCLNYTWSTQGRIIFVAIYWMSEATGYANNRWRWSWIRSGNCS